MALALIVGLLTASNVASPAQAATPPQEWFIAQTGSPNFGNGTSCAAPDAVGSDDTAIRVVLDAVTADDTITICSGVYNVTSTLIVDDSITIQGESTSGSILDGGSAVQILRLNDDDTDTTDPSEVFVLVQDLTFRNGNASETGPGCYLTSRCGGAIFVEDESDLTVRRSSFEGNVADFGGGAIYNHGESNYTGGDLRVEDSTFYRNSAGIDGGAVGVVFTGGPSLTVINSTFVENRALSRHGGAISESFGGGVVTASTFIDNQGPDGDAVRGNYTVAGSLFAGPDTSDMCSLDPSKVNNTSVSTGAGCGSAVIVTKDSLNLRGLGYWGGPTPTVWIGPGSSAVDANTGVCEALDQRGATRSSAPCDAGAYERRGPTDEGTAGTLDYTSPLLADETTLPTSSPTPSPAVTGRTIGYMSLSADVCSAQSASGVVTPASTGTCEIQWYLAPTLTADGAAADDSLTITKASQAPLIIQAPASLEVGATATLTTTGGSTGLTVTYSASPAGVCSVVGAQLSMDGPGTCTVGASMPGDATYVSVNATDVSVQTPNPEPPGPPQPASPPQSVTAAVSGDSVEIAWQQPASSGDFPVSHYQVLSKPSGGTCLVAAPVLRCVVRDLPAGESFTFEVRALTGAGWSGWSLASNAVTIPRESERSILITGSREGRRIEITGSTAGFGVGAVLRPWIRLKGQSEFARGSARILVDESGVFTWGRRAGRVVEVYAAEADGSVTSNPLPIRPRKDRQR